MSGSRQHHIWKHIQNGFGTKEFNTHQVCVYNRDGKIERTSTKKHGVEGKYFYGSDSSAADANITKLEGQLNGFVLDARRAANSTQIDSQKAGLLVTMLELRSAFLRFEVSNIIGKMVILTRESLSSPATLIKQLRAYIRQNPSRLNEELNSLGVDAESHEALTDILLNTLQKNTALRQDKVAPVLNMMFEPLLENLALMAKDAHIKALENEFTDTERTRSHQAKTFEVFQFPDESIILPDTGIAFLLKKCARPFTSSKDTIEAIFIPISSHTLIVGYDRHYAFRPINVINSVLASCAFESFIAKEEQVELQLLTSKIGKNAKLVQDSEIKKIVQSLDFERSLV